ncbi:MAG: MBG domain-containing protein [Opitutaceae bacterium]
MINFTGAAMAVPPPRPQQLTSPEQVPEGLAKSDWAYIRAAYEAGQHAFQPTPTGWQARNSGQQWTTRFDRRGFLASPEAGGWTWGLELRGYGFGAHHQTFADNPAVQAKGSRLTYQWDSSVQEWFVNDSRGLEHGFTVSTRPAAPTAPSAQLPELSFLLAVRGELRPQVTPDSLGVEFRDAAGATVLNYAGLKVWDADGKVLTSRFELADSSPTALGASHAVRLLVDERGARYPITIDPIAQQAYIKAGQVTSSAKFGCSVAVSGDTVVVGASGESSSTTGVNNTPNTSAPSAGAAYVFVRSGTTWTQQAYLKASQVDANDQFGYSVAVSGDTVVVGANLEDSLTTGVNTTPNENAGDAGAAYVFVRSGTTWTQQAYLKASQVTAGDNFGYSVAVSGDTVVIASPSEDSLTTGVNSTPNESATGAGAAYVFVRSGTTWSQQAYLKASVGHAYTGFGESVAVSGNTVVVGAMWESNNTTGVNSTSTPNWACDASGAAYVFVRSGTTWTQEAYLKANVIHASDHFGCSVAVSGDTVVVGAYQEDSSTTGVNSTPNTSFSDAGAAYVFVRNGTTWTQQAYLKAAKVTAGDWFGVSVAVSGDTLVVGASREDSSTAGVNSTPNTSELNAGAAYVFVRSGTTWTQQAYLKASQVSAGDQFGISVAVSGGTVMVGANQEDSNTTGINTVANELLGDSGAAYVFTGVGLAVPGAPTAISAISGNSQATVTFTAPNSDGGATITGYTVTSSPAGGTDSTAGSTSLSHVITGLTNGTSYTFTVTATNSIGTGSASAASSAVMPVGAPTISTPTSASVTTTSASLGGNVTATGGASLTAVGLVYSITTTNSNPQLSGTGVTHLAGTPATGVFTVSATGLNPGTAYSYAAYATNSQGTTYTSVGTFTTLVPTPTLTFTTPSAASVAVGATLTNAVTSNYTAGSYGAISYATGDSSIATVDVATGLVTGLTVGTTTITATQAASSGYNATATNTYTLTVTIGTPTINLAPSATAITYGQTLGSSTLSGGTASVGGTFAFTSSSSAPAAGTAAQSVTFTPNDATNYTSTTTTVSVTVARATPSITWATPSAITYGAALSATQLNASATVPGAIVYSSSSGTTLNAGTQTLTATFTPTDASNYNPATATVFLTVNKATPTITWATPSAITYGTALSATQLNATSGSVAGAFTYSPVNGTTLSSGTQTLSVAFVPTDPTNYNSIAATTVSIVVNKAVLTVTADEKTRVYGVANSTLTATIIGLKNSETIAVLTGAPALATSASAASGVGSYAITTAIGTLAANNYSFAFVDGTLAVTKAPLTVTADNKTRVYGVADPAFTATLSGFVNGDTATAVTGAAVLLTSATSTSPAGTYPITPALGTLAASNYAFNTFTAGTLSVGQAGQTITFGALSGKIYGDAAFAVSATTTSGLAPAYSIVSGPATVSANTVTLTGAGTVIVRASQAGNSNYLAATPVEQSFTVAKATPTISWATPSAITYGSALSTAQLNATASAPGTFTYSPVSGTTPIAGTQTLTATFAPTDTANYNSASASVSLTVNKATPSLTWATPSAITFGTVLSATQLNATASVAGIFAYNPATGSTPNAGTQTLTATFTPTDTANYNADVSKTVSIIVAKATPTITWATPSTISYGTALSATQLNPTASTPGVFTYSPGSGTIPNVGTNTLSAAFTPTDSTNYTSASASVLLNVIVAVPGAPTAISATTANGEAIVTFTAPTTTGSSAITGYTIRATASDGSVITVNTLGSPAKLTGLTPGKSYRFTVSANNSAGSSDSSTTSDALTISLVNQTITFTAPADRTSNSGSFTLTASASSGLPVSFAVLSGPALLAGNRIDLTGATGLVTLRASQAGNTTYNPAPTIEVSFAVLQGVTQAIFSKAVVPATNAVEADVAVVWPAESQSAAMLLVSAGNPLLNGMVEFQFGAGGVFSTQFLAARASDSTELASIGLQPEAVTYTITGKVEDNVLSGTIAPLGLVFRSPVPTLPLPPVATAPVGLYKSVALVQSSGVTYSVVGANNQALVLTQTPSLTTGGLTTLKADNTFSMAASNAGGGATLVGEVYPVTTVATATLIMPGKAPVVFSGKSIATQRTDRLINLSSRAKVGSGESVLITGFVIGGPEAKKVLIRAAGPALGAFGLTSTLPNPVIKIYQGSNLIAQNDDWDLGDAPEIARIGAFGFIYGTKDAALLTTLAPGAYTAQISDPSGTGSGVALAEIYDASMNPNADYQRLVNISSRGLVTPDDGVLIGGFIVTGNTPKTLLIRGIGPALTSFDIAGALPDPALTIYQDSKVIATNEGWANSAAIATAAIQTGAFALPSASKDSAVLITLNPGAYTAQIKSAKNASSGVALIEIYEVP